MPKLQNYLILLYFLYKLFFVEYSIRELAFFILFLAVYFVFDSLFDTSINVKRARLSSFFINYDSKSHIVSISRLRNDIHNGIYGAFIVLNISFANLAFFL
ncbi:hypothetical protein BC749_1011292 [Flavobacterium araucananum]|jgi:hypothetical protein|nr:hypothetical protein BC749_1011292 [Flavobacterium araucananum]